jgi:hypothetical protein
MKRELQILSWQITVLMMLTVIPFSNGCAPASPRVGRVSGAYDPKRFLNLRLNRLTPTIGTNENTLDVQFVADYTDNASIKEAADQRVLQLIGECNSLRVLVQLSSHVPPCTHAEDARQRAENLLTSWNGAGPESITNLLPALFVPSKYNYSSSSLPVNIVLANSRQTTSNILESSLEQSIVKATKQILAGSYEQITDEDYARNFTVQREVLGPLVDKIKLNNQHTDREDVDIVYSVVAGQGHVSVNSVPFYSIIGEPSAMVVAGIRLDSFKMPGLFYQRFRFTSNEVIREIVRRENSNGGAVSTEVITWDGIHYRRSSVEGF